MRFIESYSNCIDGCNYYYTKYAYSKSASLDCQLGELYEIASISSLDIDCIGIEEPCGMDSSWWQFEGDLIESLGKDDFVDRFRSIDVDEMYCEGKINGSWVSVALFPKSCILRVINKNDIDSFSKEEFIKQIESIVS